MRVVVIGYTGSSHLAQRLSLLRGLGWDIHAFPVNSDPPSAMLRDVTVYVPGDAQRDQLHPSVEAVEIAPTQFLLHDDLVDALSRLLRNLTPDLVHSEQLSPAAYIAADAFERGGTRTLPWMVSNWGPCISYFGRDLVHRERVRAVLRACDYYTCECYRDLGLARAFGYRGPFLPVVPIAAHFDIPHIRSLRTPGLTSARRTISLKGYEHFYGRAFVALDALRSCADLVEGYELALTGAMEHVVDRARQVCDATGMRLTIASGIDRRASYDDILRVHGRSRLSISLATADGLCTSCFEAMAMGSLPVQSDSGCSDEWALEGLGALYAEADDQAGVAAALRRGLLDDDLVDRAAEVNAETIEEHFDRDVVGRRYRDLYQHVAAAATAPAGAIDDGWLPLVRDAELGRRPHSSGDRRDLLARLYLDPQARRWQDIGEDLWALPSVRHDGPIETGPDVGDEDAAALSRTIADRDAVIRDLRWALERQAEQLLAVQIPWAHEVADSERVGPLPDQEIASRDDTIVRLHREVATRDALVAELQEELAARAELEGTSADAHASLTRRVARRVVPEPIKRRLRRG